MERRDFVQFTGLAAGALALGRRVPNFSGALTPIPAGGPEGPGRRRAERGTNRRRHLCDVRIGRYLNQFVITRDTKVQNITNTESYGVGVRVIADGTWGFAATNDVTHRRRGQAAARRPWPSPRPTPSCRPSRCSWRRSKGVGEVSWKTPIEKNALDVPIEEKADLLLAVNAAGAQGGRQLRQLAAVPGQRAEVLRLDRRQLHRPGRAPHLARLPVTAIDKADRQVPSRATALSRRWAWAASISTARPAGKISAPGGVARYGNSYDMIEDAAPRRRRPRKS